MMREFEIERQFQIKIDILKLIRVKDVLKR